MNTNFIDSSANEAISLWLDLDGREEPLELFERPNTQHASIGIKETDDVSFVMRTSNLSAKPLLLVQDIEIRPTSFRKTADFPPIAEFRWKPDPEKKFFLNLFGLSNLTLELETSHETRTLYASVEVFAKKLNATRVYSMLHYLECKMPDVTRSCFSATSSQTDSQDTGHTLLVLLREAERQLIHLHSLLPQFRYKKRSRLTPKPTVMRIEEATFLSENSISWVLSHLDELALTTSPTLSSVFLRNRYFELPYIESTLLNEDADVYENQIIAGYLDSIVARVAEVKRHAMDLAMLSGQSEYLTVPLGFASFSQIKQEYERKFCLNIQGKCNELEKICHECIHFFQQHLPVRRVLTESPTMTPGFLSNSHYRELFQQILIWYRLGKLTTLGERYLYGLRTLDKLYEFFCLYRIVDALEEDGWQLSDATTNSRTQSPLLAWNIRPAEQYVFRRLGRDLLRLYYEPTIYNRASESLDLIVSEHGKTQRTPDFLIEVCGTRSSGFIVLDAKYSVRQKVWEKYMVEAIKKYIHGLGSTRGGSSPVIALFLVYPRSPLKTFDQYELFHKENYDIFSNRPMLPSFGTVEVSPNETTDSSTKTGSTLTELLGRTIYITKQHIN